MTVNVFNDASKGYGMLNFKLLSNLHNLVNASSDVLTASDNSIGSSGGTTDVKIRVHSKNSLYLSLLGSLVPVKTQSYLNKSTNLNHKKGFMQQGFIQKHGA